MKHTTPKLISDELLSQHSSVIIEDENHGLCVCVNNTSAFAKVSLYGAHVLSFIPNRDNRERLWLSDHAIFDGETPIRGGIPICWPWFASYESAGFTTILSDAYNLPSHGFARTQYWQLRTISEQIKNNEVHSTLLEFVPTELGKYGTNNDLEVTLIVEVGETLALRLISQNNSAIDIEISQALHSYFAVNDISNVEVLGVTQPYSDKPSNTQENPVTLPYIIEQEVDRIHYLSEQEQLQINHVQIINNADKTPVIMVDIANQGNDSVVVWNPWQEKAIAMKDMSNNAYTGMLCIEAANTLATCIKAGEQYTLSQIIR